MGKKVWYLLLSISFIYTGIRFCSNTSESGQIFSGIVLMIIGVGLGIYSIYLIVMHKYHAQKQQESIQKLAIQKAFINNNTTPSETTNKTITPAVIDSQGESATIIVRWYADKMGFGQLPVTVNGVAAGNLKKGNLQVTYHTNVPFNVITMGIYKTDIELSPGDTVEYFVAGNGIRHGRTTITRNAKE